MSAINGPAATTMSRTAQALAMVESGANIRATARAMGITPQSIYRLQKYRKLRGELRVCSECGSIVRVNK